MKKCHTQLENGEDKWQIQTPQQKKEQRLIVIYQKNYQE